MDGSRPLGPLYEFLHDLRPQRCNGAQHWRHRVEIWVDPRSMTHFTTMVRPRPARSQTRRHTSGRGADTLHVSPSPDGRVVGRRSRVA